MKKIGLLCLALVLALGTLGVGYAMWSDTLTIDGIINTGKVDVIFASQYDNDATAGQHDPKEAGSWDVSGDTPVWTGDRYTKDVANTGSTYSDKSATITVNQAYPCYWGSVIWDVKNIGTIPVKLYSVTLTELSKDKVEYVMNKALDIGTRYYVDVDAQRVNTVLQAGDDFSFKLSAFGCDQIDPFVEAVCKGLGYLDVTVHVEQDAEQKTEYDFTIDYVFANWNE